MSLRPVHDAVIVKFANAPKTNFLVNEDGTWSAVQVSQSGGTISVMD